MDPTEMIVQLFSQVLPMLPAKYATDLTILGSFVVSTCAVISLFWSKPKDGSKLLPLYNTINGLGLNALKAKNADNHLTKGN